MTGGTDVRFAAGVGAVRRRLRRLLRSWPSPIADAVGPVLERVHPVRRGRRLHLHLPYWSVLPYCIAERRALAPADIEDILFAQYCVFFAIRLQDDLVDGHRKPGPVISAPSLFLLAGLKALLGCHPAGSKIGEEACRLVRTSLAAIVRSASLQKKRDVSWRVLRRVYAEQNAALKIGLLAASGGSTHSTLYRRISRCADHLAVAGQLLDDLEDIQEDRAAGRMNAAARFCLPPQVYTHRSSLAALGAASRTIRRYLVLPKRAFHAADRLLAPLHLSFAREYIEQSLAVILEWEQMLCRAGSTLSSTTLSRR